MRISIITIHLNDFAGLDRTMGSLESFNKEPGTEWIVVDGGSAADQEGTDVLDRVRALADKYVSEVDDGIYDAMNKGTRLATGEYVLYLNAGDELHPAFNILEFAEAARDERVGMIWGRCQERYENGSVVQVKTRSTSWAWYGMPVFHPAIFFRRDVLGHSPYDTDYQVAADYDLVCRLLKGGAIVRKLDSIISIFFRGGLSHQRGDIALREESQIRRQHFATPEYANRVLMAMRRLNAQLAKIAWLRGLWRKWV